MSEHPHPLRTVHLRNFKSVEAAEVRVAPLTVLVGANSSGKSSVIQALLALHQVAANESPLSTFALNGPKVGLGFLSNVRRWGAAEDDPVEIGVDLGLDRVAPSGFGFQHWSLLHSLRQSSLDVHLGLAVGAGEVGRENQSAPPISRTTFDVSIGNRRTHLELRRKKPPTYLPASELFAGSAYVTAGERFDFGMRGHLKSERSTTTVGGAAYTGAIPLFLGSTGAANELYADAFLQLLVNYGVPPSDGLPTARKSTVVNAAAKSLRDWKDEPERRPFMSVMDPFFDDRSRLAGAVAALGRNRDDLLRSIAAKLGAIGRERFIVATEDAFLNHYGGSGLLEFLREKTFHLAGLRVAPQPLYPFTSLPSDSDIGSRGENLAMVLLTIGDKAITWPRSDGSITDGPLLDALRHWVRHLELLDDLSPVHHGAQGVALEVVQGDVTLNVTAVGVGVSQVLPVLVRCLLAAPGELVLLEQPELHLHPAAQLGLADFLLACVRSGRQIVLETHSEHLVNRLRRRVAEEVDEPELVAELISIVFAERTDLVTDYRRVELNTAGGFQGWPGGFFPEGVDELRSLMDAGLRKRALSPESDGPP